MRDAFWQAVCRVPMRDRNVWNGHPMQAERGGFVEYL